MGHDACLYFVNSLAILKERNHKKVLTLCCTDIQRDNTPSKEIQATELASPTTLDSEFCADHTPRFFHETQAGSCFAAVENKRFKYLNNSSVSTETRAEIEKLVNAMHHSYS